MRFAILLAAILCGFVALTVVAINLARQSTPKPGKDWGCVMAVGAEFSPGGRYEHASLSRMDTLLSKCPDAS